MDVAIWLYLWFIDKMTSIDEAGVGKVLGGKPIRHSDVESELGVSERTYNRWLSILRAHGYINTKRTPYGLQITVNKAHKAFGKRYAKNGMSDTPEVADHSDKNGGSNKTVHIDNSSKTSEQSSIDVPTFIELFSLINPSYAILFARPPQRKASERLLILHDIDWWRKFMPAYQHALEDRYCPRATTPVQMEEKLGAIEHYGRSKKADKLKSLNNVVI